jgi:hypothetical protein
VLRTCAKNLAAKRTDARAAKRDSHATVATAPEVPAGSAGDRTRTKPKAAGVERQRATAAEEEREKRQQERVAGVRRKKAS